MRYDRFVRWARKGSTAASARPGAERPHDLLRGLIATMIHEGQALPDLSRSSNSLRRLARDLGTVLI